MDFEKFIKPELLALIPALYFLGNVIKTGFKVDSTKIPLILGTVGVFLSALYVFATSPIAGYQDVLMSVFTSLVQGFLAAGASVYCNQLYKQKLISNQNKNADKSLK